MPSPAQPVYGLQVSDFTVPRHPGASSEVVSARMSRAARRDTAPEVALRKELHRRGMRFRVVYPVPGNRRRSIDVAFTRAKVAVFVDGCFWHGCPEHGSQPTANKGWWEAKLQANTARDRDTDRLLAEAGWRVLRIWEHASASEAADIVAAALHETEAASGPGSSSPPAEGTSDCALTSFEPLTARTNRQTYSSDRKRTSLTQ